MAAVLKKLSDDYAASVRETPKLRLVDAFLLYTLSTGFIQVVYMLLVGTFPFNSFLSSLFCHIALFVGAVSLRFHLTSKEFRSISPERALGEFVFCGLVLFFVVFSFMG